MTNAADTSQVKNVERKVKDRRRQELDDVRGILATASGRRFFWRYLGECGVFKSSFTGNSETFFLEGSRNVGLKLMSDLNEADPKAYLLMIQENSKGEV